MEPFFAVAFGAIMSAAAYLLLSRNVLRMVLGLLLLSNGVNLSIFIAGRMGPMTPPILADKASLAPATLTTTAAEVAAVTEIANPLPQALILTAIVISFALTAFAVVLFERAYRSLGTLDTEAMREMEPPFSGSALSNPAPSGPAPSGPPLNGSAPKGAA